MDALKIKIKPLNQRAKSRVNEHGEWMLIHRVHTTDKNRILFRSVDKTWRGEYWLGWFEIGKDIELVQSESGESG